LVGTVNAYIAGFALLCYVLGLLISQQQIPLTMNIIFPKLSGESAYSLITLLGKNIMAHNFYIHSSVVQVNLLFNAF
jgi:ethylene-insensitive protein 2